MADPLPGDGEFQGRLSIPYLTPAGVVSMKYRSLDDEAKPKYHQPTGQQPRLFNTRDLMGTPDVVVICEGEFDTMVMSGLVGLPAVGVPGVSSWEERYHPRCFADVPRIIICTDNDTVKEENYGQRLARKIKKGAREAEIIPPPDNLDINDWFLRDGADAIRESFDIHDAE